MRAPDWDAAAFAADHAAALARCASAATACWRCTIPLDLGRPRAGAASSRPTRLIEAAARAHGALVLDLRGFGARNLVMTDHVHPTAFGQVAIAERALDVLAADGMDVRVRPSTLISPAERTRARRAAGRLDLRLPAPQGAAGSCLGGRRAELLEPPGHVAIAEPRRAR